MSGLKQKKNTAIKEIVIENPIPEELDKVDENVLNDMIDEAMESTKEESTLPTLEDDKLFKKKDLKIISKSELPPLHPNLPTVNKISEPIEIKTEEPSEPVIQKPKKKTRKKRPPLSEEHKRKLAIGRAKSLATRRAKAKAKKEAKLKEQVKSMNLQNNETIEKIQKTQTMRTPNMDQATFFKYMDNWEKYKNKRSGKIYQKPLPTQPKPKPYNPMDIYFDAEAQLKAGYYGNGRKRPSYI